MNSVDSGRENSQNEDLLHIVLPNASTINRSSNTSPSNKTARLNKVLKGPPKEIKKSKFSKEVASQEHFPSIPTTPDEFQHIPITTL